MSDRMSSILMISMSRAGSIEPATWIMSSFSKHRTTWMIASTSLMFARNWLPRPSPCEAPFTSPAMSTISSLAGRMRSEVAISERRFSRVSGTSTIPTLGSMVQNGKFAAWAFEFSTMALNRVDLPTFGSPTFPALSISWRLCIMPDPALTKAWAGQACSN